MTDDQRNLSALLFAGIDIEAARAQLLDLLSAWSEDRWAAGWIDGIDQEAHEAGGVWEAAGRVIGWPLGYRGAEGWVTWDEATAYYRGKRSS